MELECKELGESIAKELAKSPQGAAGLGNGPFPLYVAQIAEVSQAEQRCQEIHSEMRELQDQLALVALVNDNIDVAEVVASVTSDMNALGEELIRQVHFKFNVIQKLYVTFSAVKKYDTKQHVITCLFCFIYRRQSVQQMLKLCLHIRIHCC